jgi:hypothetical protein
MGKSLLWVMLCVACANNVPADRSTGPDGKPKGAQEVVLEANVGKQRGVVTYPGGDRIDWKKIVLPEKAKGTLDLTMKYTTPRPNLKATFDVFDQWFHPVSEKVAGQGRNKSIKIDKAKGTYFVRVYAPRRTDAASYVIEASFEPEIAIEFDMTKVPVADPPRLPAIPEPDPECLVAYDKSNPNCETKCPPGAPKNHAGCQTPADPSKTPPIVTTPPPPPPEVKKPVVARIMKPEVQGDGSIIVTIGAGSDHGVDATWKAGSLLRGDTRDPAQKYSGGTLTIIRVNKQTTIAKLRVGITNDVLRENSNVVLGP